MEKQPGRARVSVGDRGRDFAPFDLIEPHHGGVLYLCEPFLQPALGNRLLIVCLRYASDLVNG
jgi:hypothetical protein